MLIGGAEGHEACHRARKGMLIGGAERHEAYHWARYGVLIGGADGHKACHRARFGMLIGGADKHEACHWATQRAMAGLRTAAREKKEFDRLLRGIAIQACPGISLTSRGNLHRRSPPRAKGPLSKECKGDRKKRGTEAFSTGGRVCPSVAGLLSAASFFKTNHR